jgi:hypothetical protein
MLAHVVSMMGDYARGVQTMKYDLSDLVLVAVCCVNAAFWYPGDLLAVVIAAITSVGATAVLHGIARVVRRRQYLDMLP